MATSAKAIYFATPEAGTFTYVFLIRNTTPSPFDIYAILIAVQYDVPLVPGGGLGVMMPVAEPSGWAMGASTPVYGFMSGGTNWNGSPMGSGYIMPGGVGTFVFQCTTTPPETLPFGCCFYDGNNEWGFGYNGIANRVDCVPASHFPRTWADADSGSAVPTTPAVAPNATMRGTTTRTIGGEGGVPSVNITYDRLGNIVKMSANPPEVTAKK